MIVELVMLAVLVSTVLFFLIHDRHETSCMTCIGRRFTINDWTP